MKAQTKSIPTNGILIISYQIGSHDDVVKWAERTSPILIKATGCGASHPDYPKLIQPICNPEETKS